MESADFVIVGNSDILNHFDITSGLKNGGRILLNAPGVKDDDLEGRLAMEFRKSIAAKDAQLFVLDTSAVEKIVETPELAVHLLEAAWRRLASKSLQ